MARDKEGVFWDDRWICEHADPDWPDPDHWAYTEEFERLYDRYMKEHAKGTLRGFHRRCIYLRKARRRAKYGQPKLPRFSGEKLESKPITGKVAKQLIEFYEQYLIAVNQIAYTPGFDHAYDLLDALTTKRYTRYDLMEFFVTARKGRKVNRRERLYHGRKAKKPEGGFGIC